MEKTIEQLKRFIAQSGRSQNQIARGMGVSGGALSAWMSGSYKGDNERLTLAVQSYLRREEGRRTALNIPVVKIGNHRHIHLAMDTAASEIDIALICGHAGTGKTTALLDYVNEFGGIYILADKTCSQYRLITILADKLGIHGKGSAAQITERIIHTLEDLDTLIVIDEADYLTDGALEYLRQVVYDAGKTGLVLCGLLRLEAAIQNIRNDHEQLLSRIGVRLMLEDISPEDMKSVVEAAWPGLPAPVKAVLVSSSSIRFRSKPSPCLRTLEKLLKRAHGYVLREGKSTPTVEDVREIAKLVMRRN